jgi:2-methylisocitrate lyase-like PEP mutase family enzyme
LATVIVQASSLPVTADLENGFADDPEGVAETVRGALAAGLAGCSIEDSTGRAQEPIYELAAATERIAAAVEVAHAGPVHLVLTARAENYLHGRPDLEDTIARLQAYEAAGADALYAPGVLAGEDIAAIVAAVQRPVNVLARPGMASVDELAALGVSRISVGSAFAFAAIDALVEAARELREQGTYGFTERSTRGMAVSPDAFAPPAE